MPEIVKCNFYNINECGYFKRGTNEHQFGSITEILSDLYEWSQNKDIQQTKLFSPAGGSDLFPTYLLNVVETGEDWLLTTWSQVPSSKSGVASVMGSSKVDEPAVVMNAIQAGSIPGFATYFWFIPELSLFASVRLKNRTQTGQAGMQKYIETALSKISSYTHVVPAPVPKEESKILGYALPDGEPQMLYPRFKTSVARNKGNIEYILQNAENISKVCCKETLELNKPIENDLWQSALQLMGLKKARECERKDSVQLKYEFSPETFGANEVKQIIAAWEAKEGEKSEWDDYGFYFVGQSNKPYWLSHDLLRTDVNLNVEWLNEELASPDVLLDELRKHKKQILKNIRR